MDTKLQKEFQKKVAEESLLDAWRLLCRVSYVDEEIHDREKALKLKEDRLIEISEQIQKIEELPDNHSVENRKKKNDLATLKNQQLEPAIKSDKEMLGKVIMESMKVRGQGEFFLNFAKYAEKWEYKTDDEKIAENKKSNDTTNTGKNK